MKIVFNCPLCQIGLAAKSEKSGAWMACPKCKGKIQIPSPEPEKQTPTPDALKTSLATERQKAFATKLGINFPANVDRATISEMIEVALQKQEFERDEKLAAIKAGEVKIREELRAEVMAEFDEDDPRVSKASIEKILDALARRDIGAILITFEYGLLNGEEDLEGESFNLSSTNDLELEDMQRIVSMIGVAFIRQKSQGNKGESR